MDVDETVLDNSPNQARLVLEGTEYADASWDAWVAEQSAAPVPGRQPRHHRHLPVEPRRPPAGGHARQPPRARAAGEGHKRLPRPRHHRGPLPGHGLRQVLPPPHGARNYRVLMQFGDQLGDFVTPPAKTTAAAASTVDAHAAWFGERWWMLPNPTYGAWEPALFDNDWSRDRHERRAAKRAALRPLR